MHELKLSCDTLFLSILKEMYVMETCCDSLLFVFSFAIPVERKWKPLLTQLEKMNPVILESF